MAVLASFLPLLLLTVICVDDSSAETCYDGYGSHTYCDYGCCYRRHSSSQYCCSEGASYIGLIVGCVIGGIILIACIAACVCCCIKYGTQSGRVVHPVMQPTMSGTSAVGYEAGTSYGYPHHPAAYTHPQQPAYGLQPQIYPNPAFEHPPPAYPYTDPTKATAPFH